MRKAHLVAGSVLAVACLPVMASAQTVLFSENFDIAGAGSRFTQHTSTNDGQAPDFMVDFNYDYGAFEYLRFPQGTGGTPTVQPIPPAPGSATTRGLRISVNDNDPAAAMAFQLIPNGVTPGTDFRMQFDMWMNYNGGALGGTGSTEAMVVGLNTDPSAAGIIGPSPTAFNPQAVNGYAFTANGEGGAANDYRMYDRGDPIDDGPAFPKVNGTWAAADELRFDRTTGELVLTGAGTVILDRPSNHINSYYDQVFPGDAIGGGSFETRGAPGKAWVPVVVEQRGNEITFSMNGQIISTLFTGTAPTGVPEFGYTDEFNSIASPSIDNFILYDNLLITQLGAAPRFTAASGNYSNGANWSGGAAPNGANAKADFGGAPSPATVTVDAPVTLRSIVFSGPESYTVNGPATITMSDSGNTLMSNAGSHTLNAPVNSQGHLSAFVQEGSTLRVTNLTHDASKGFMKAGTGTFEVNRVRSSHITQTGGTLKLLPGGISRTGRVDVLNSTSKLDVTTAGLIVDWTRRTAPGDPSIDNNPREAIITEILTGFNGGDWQGFGIYSSNAQTDPNYAVGYVDTSILTSVTSFGGEPVDDTAMLIRGTRRGDANVDGVVNLQDFNLLAANFGSSDARWWQGDFNYDGTVNLQDFNALAGNFGQSAAGPEVTPEDWANLASAIPEPSSLALLGIGAVALVRRRRRN